MFYTQEQYNTWENVLQALTFSNLQATVHWSDSCFISCAAKTGLVVQGKSAHNRQSRTGHYFIWSEAERWAEARSLLVKYEWNPAWQEKWGLSPGDTEQCACVLCWLWSYTLRRPVSHSAMLGRRTVFHKWAPVLAGEWQATGSVRIWERWGRGPGSGRALTASAKPKDAPVKLLDFPCHRLTANSQPGPFKHVVQDWLQRLVCVPPLFLKPRRSRGAHPDWMTALIPLFQLSVSPLLFVFSFFLSLCWLSYYLLSLPVSPFSVPAPLSLSQPAHLYSSLT